MTSAACTALLLQLLLHLQPCAGIGTTPRRITSQLASFTMDFHAPDSACKKHEGLTKHCWANASIFNVNLASPVLKGATKALAPAIWRIGGTPADSTLYAMGSMTAGCPDPSSFYCLTEDRWRALLDFAREAGVRIVFGLNYMSHLNISDPASHWDEGNARALLEVTRAYQLAHNITDVVYGFELGNELNGGGDPHREPNTARYGRAFMSLRVLIAEVWAGALYADSPVILGPDVSWIHDTDNAWTDAVVRNTVPVMNAVTFHHYPAGHLGGNDSLIFDEGHLAETSRNFSCIVSNIRALVGPSGSLVAADVPIWWGEGAFDYHSGHEGVTNGYEDMLWAAVMYGITSNVGIDVWARSTLTGGYYELLDHQAGFRPNPSFWIMHIFKQVVTGVGTDGVVPGASSVTIDLKFHVFPFKKSDGSLVYMLVNLGAAWATFSGPSGQEVGWSVWALTSPSGDMHGKGVLLNDYPGTLEIHGDGSLPPMGGKHIVGSSLTVPAHSVVFAVPTSSIADVIV